MNPIITAANKYVVDLSKIDYITDITRTNGGLTGVEEQRWDYVFYIHFEHGNKILVDFPHHEEKLCRLERDVLINKWKQSKER